MVSHPPDFSLPPYFLTQSNPSSRWGRSKNTPARSITAPTATSAFHRRLMRGLYDGLANGGWWVVNGGDVSQLGRRPPYQGESAGVGYKGRSAGLGRYLKRRLGCTLPGSGRGLFLVYDGAMDGPVTTATDFSFSPIGVLLLALLVGVALLAVALLVRKKVTKPLYKGLLVFGIAAIFAAVALSLLFPLVDVVAVRSSSGRDSAVQ
jgi:hypothetical protein